MLHHVTTLAPTAWQAVTVVRSGSVVRVLSTTSTAKKLACVRCATRLWPSSAPAVAHDDRSGQPNLRRHRSTSTRNSSGNWSRAEASSLPSSSSSPSFSSLNSYEDASRRFRRVVPQGDFKLAPELQGYPSVKEVKAKEVVSQLQTRVLELAGSAAAGTGSGRGGDRQAAQLLAALARRLGLDEGELSRLARQWAETKPFSARRVHTTDKLSSSESRKIADVQAEIKIFGQRAIDRAVLSAFLHWLREEASVERIATTAQLASLVEHLDLQYPAEWYPRARAVKRKLILHVGPTNSGKTYNALCALAKARTGIFAGPLRLLATEVYNRFNAGTIGGLTPDSPRVCNLVTGEEVRIHDALAGLTSCTVEMINLETHFDVAVIDEIQMIADPSRGASWTTALLGLIADEIHLCGEPSVVDLVQRIGRACGDEVIINRYERLSPLAIAEHSLHGNFRNVRRGDCVVTFSRNNIFAVKKAVEQQTGLKVAVAYGGLPPEVREEQAKGFNAAGTSQGYDVMVGSDAIGMGLNLKIKRIIFETLHKWDGQQSVELSSSQIKQIAGRAGRYGMHSKSDSPSAPDEVDAVVEDGSSENDGAAAAIPSLNDSSSGIVTCLDEEDMPLLRRAMSAVTQPLDRAALHPTTNHLERFISLLPPTTTQAHVLEIFPVIASAADDYFVPSFGQSLKISDIIKHIESLTIADRWQLAHAPVPVRDPACVRAFTDFAFGHAAGSATNITEWIREQNLSDLLAGFRSAEEDLQRAQSPTGEHRIITTERARAFSSASNLAELESLHRCLSLYRWLGNRFALHYPQAAEARLFKIEVEQAIEFILLHMPMDRKKSRKTRTTPASGADLLHILTGDSGTPSAQQTLSI